MLFAGNSLLEVKYLRQFAFGHRLAGPLNESLPEEFGRVPKPVNPKLAPTLHLERGNPGVLPYAGGAIVRSAVHYDI
jgi:hypothetical protein